MSCPNCNIFHSKCKAGCCGPVPMNKGLFNKNFELVLRPFELMEFENETILPITEDLSCVFLKADYGCAIYKDRPEVCRKFGDESHIHMTCPYQKANGSSRNNKEQNKLLRKQHSAISERTS